MLVFSHNAANDENPYHTVTHIAQLEVTAGVGTRQGQQGKPL